MLDVAPNVIGLDFVVHIVKLVVKSLLRAKMSDTSGGIVRSSFTFVAITN